MVPALDHLESRQLLSMGMAHPHHAALEHHHHALRVHHPALVGRVEPGRLGATLATPAAVTGLNNLTNPNINGILNATAAVASNDVWAVGVAGNGTEFFDNVFHGQPLIEHFNGTRWSVTPSPTLGGYGELNGVAAVASNNVWAVGQGSPTNPLIEHWNGTKWSIVPSPNVAGATLNAVTAISANNIWAVGSVIEHWNGTSWKVVAAPAFGTLFGASGTSSTDVWAVGDTSNSFPTSMEILHFNGSAWSQVAVPTLNGLAVPILKSVTAVSPTDVWAVGTAQTTNIPHDHAAAGFILHFNGQKWSVFPSPNPEAGLSRPGGYGLVGISAISANNIWAVGTFNDPNSSLDLPLTEHFNGTSWSIVSSANVIGEESILSGVTALGNGTVVAVGFATSSGDDDPFAPQNDLNFDQPLMLQN
jgi:hypothetical protein